MRAFLTGASGFVGGHLLRALEAAGRDVVCLVRPGSSRRNLEGTSAEVVEGDLTSPESLRGALDACSEVYHCAADYRLFVPDPKGMYATNVEGTDNLLEAAAQSGVDRVVYTSSVGALGLLPGGEPADEETPVALEDMIGHYKRSKFLAERVVEDWVGRGLPAVVVHPSTPVGRADWKPTATGKMILDFARGKVPAYVDTGLNLVDVRDVAVGHILAAERGRIGEKYILGNENLSLREIFDLLAEIAELRAPNIRLPHVIPLAFAALDTARARFFGGEPTVAFDAARLARHKMYFSADKAVRELGLPQTPVRQALEHSVEWFRDNGYLEAS